MRAVQKCVASLQLYIATLVFFVLRMCGVPLYVSEVDMIHYRVDMPVEKGPGPSVNIFSQRIRIERMKCCLPFSNIDA